MGNWHKILVAVDEMTSSLKAVQYVGQVAGPVPDVSICLLHVYPEPPPDFFHKGGDLNDYQAGRIAGGEKIFTQCLKILADSGIPRESVYCTTHMAAGKTISETVLEVRRQGNFGTIVTGKRGVSKAEEFLFGSISNALARHSQGFTTWIVG